MTAAVNAAHHADRPKAKTFLTRLNSLAHQSRQYIYRLQLPRALRPYWPKLLRYGPQCPANPSLPVPTINFHCLEKTNEAHYLCADY
jgi:hypothetical protein